MTDKKRIKRNIRYLQRVKTWQLLILLVLATFVAATFLRLNNIGMLQRREAVIAADKSGNQEDIANRLYELQRYVSTHMNTDMGSGIYLENQFQRDREAALQAATDGTDSSNNVYKEITDACRAQYSIWASYFQCVTDRLNSTPAGQDSLATVQQPNIEAYKHNFASPVWSPDFAGWSVVLVVAIAFLTAARLIGLAILKTVLHIRNKSI